MILKTENLYKKYKKKQIIKNISIHLKKGEIVGIVGPNGSGKTTIFYSILGVISIDYGKIILNGKEITKKPIYKRARMGIGYLPQEKSIFRKLTVEENILCILEMNKKYLKNKKKILEHLIKKLKLQNIRKNKGDLLSGGERRRTEIARCLSTNPNFILLDEPFSGIDPISILDLKKIFFSLKKDNIGLLITDHNVREIFSIADRIYLIHEGKILRHGNSDNIKKDNLVKKVYLGNFIN